MAVKVKYRLISRHASFFEKKCNDAHEEGYRPSSNIASIVTTQGAIYISQLWVKKELIRKEVAKQALEEEMLMN